MQDAHPLPGGSGWTVAFENFGTLSTEFVVDATGRASTFARQMGVTRARLDRLVALVAFVESAPQSEVDLLIEARPGGWWYTAPLPGARAVSAFLTDADLVPSGRSAQQAFWARELRETTHVIRRLRVGASLTVSVVPAGTERLATVSGNGWVAVGDSAASFDPLSSLGIAHALESGRLAGLAVDAALKGERRPLAAYARLEQRRADEYDILRRGFYATEQRWVETTFWARRAGYRGRSAPL